MVLHRWSPSNIIRWSAHRGVAVKKEARSKDLASMSKPESVIVYEFGPFKLNSDGSQLTRNNKPIYIPKRLFNLLLILLEQPDTTITREELASRLWPDIHVDITNNLNNAIYTLRDILGDTASNPTFVQTILGEGYRFIAPLTQTPKAPAKKPFTLPSSGSR